MEKVHIENDWYDGPRKGVADFDGIPHRFISNFQDFEDQERCIDTFKLFPISVDELNLEIEQWAIFVEWNEKYEAGEVETNSHPGHGGINKRWDELEKILSNKREAIPEVVFNVTAVFENNNQKNRYEKTGPDYGVIWKLSNENT